MTGLTGSNIDVDLTLPATTRESEEHDLQDPGMAGPGTVAAGALIPPPPVHYHPRTAR